jgi:hypothetical protein
MIVNPFQKWWLILEVCHDQSVIIQAANLIVLNIDQNPNLVDCDGSVQADKNMVLNQLDHKPRILQGVKNFLHLRSLSTFVSPSDFSIIGRFQKV